MIKRFLAARVFTASALTLLTALGVALFPAQSLAQASGAKPKRLLVVTVTMGFHHSSVTTADKVLAELGEKSGLYTLDYVRSGARPKPGTPEEAAWIEQVKKDLAAKMSPEALKNYDGVIFASTTGDLPLPDNDAFIAWVKSGKAFIGIHAAADTFHGYPPYIEMLGAEFKTHGAQVKIEALNQDPKHPATSKIGKSYIVTDEIYQFLNFHRESVHGLLTMDKHPNTGMPGDYPVAWCKQFGEGRVFYTSLGHREDVWAAPVYQDHVLGGIKWALGLAQGDATPQGTRAELPADEAQAGFRLLFDGEDLKGWRLRDADGKQTWSAQNGMLVNVIPPGGHGIDLVSAENFKDFVVRYEYMIPKNSNSGFYLHGRHEIQIIDDLDSGQPTPGGNGAIYQLAAVSQFVSRKPGEWQTVEATMKGNRVSVILNGVKVHDNVLVDRATGGELDTNVNDPGPFMLQGDHGTVAFRNIRVKTL